MLLRHYFQIGDAKDLSSPFGQAAASLDYRLHHMLHLQHQFLHPLDHRLPFGSAFRPLAPSAFAPPTKRLKLEAEIGGSPQAQQLPGMSSMFSPQTQTQPQDLAPQSPATSTASRSPTGSVLVPSSQATPGGDEEREAASATPGSENTERSTPEEGRPYRSEYFFDFHLLTF